MKVGILGAGQLARMMILNSKYLGIDFVLFCPAITATTANLAEHIIAEETDKVALERFCEMVDVVTFESENIATETLDFIIKRKQVYPPKAALKTTQDRLYEKKLFNELEINTNSYMAIENYQDLKSAADKFGLPLIVKARRFGYDGKHQYHIRSKAELDKLKNENFSNFIAESFVPFSHEVSIIGVRDQQGKMACYDLCHNEHQAGILRKTTNIIANPLFNQAKSYLIKVMQHFSYVGVLTIEFFVHDGKLLANEMAPRVHNSGHWTIEGCPVSQFENHIRAIFGLTLGNTESIAKCEMTNCISTMPNIATNLQNGTHYHDYQKSPRENRKLGHITKIST